MQNDDGRYKCLAYHKLQYDDIRAQMEATSSDNVIQLKGC
jgi:hypothetical protein